MKHVRKPEVVFVAKALGPRDRSPVGACIPNFICRPRYPVSSGASASQSLRMGRKAWG